MLTTDIKFKRKIAYVEIKLDSTILNNNPTKKTFAYSNPKKSF